MNILRLKCINYIVNYYFSLVYKKDLKFHILNSL